MMICRAFSSLVSLTVINIGLAQVPEATQRLNQLKEHWRWMEYWEGKTELGTNYYAGRQFPALFFWKGDGAPASVGFCSLDLGFCQFYPNTFIISQCFSMQTKLSDDLASAFRRFLRDAFEQYESPIWQGRPQLAGPKEEDYTSEVIRMTLPALDPPEAIHTRKMRPQAEIEDLLREFGCGLNGEECRFHIMIPFYGEHDLSIPVYKECRTGCEDGDVPAILFFKLVKGRWWLGATNVNTSPVYVSRTRRQIEKALMIEVGR